MYVKTCAEGRTVDCSDVRYQEKDFVSVTVGAAEQDPA